MGPAAGKAFIHLSPSTEGNPLWPSVVAQSPLQCDMPTTGDSGGGGDGGGGGGSKA